jgi:voltage-gated potassium channel
MTTESSRRRWRRIVFGTDTPAGQRFDKLLILAIIASVLLVMLDSEPAMHARYGGAFYALEWFFTLLFTAEYALRLWTSENRRQYATSFFGLVDLLSILPTYLRLVLPGANYLLTIRILRVLRIFRVFKLFSFMSEADLLMRALMRARRKIGVFLFTVMIVIISFGSLIYAVEGPQNGFTSIPTSVYWAIVTVTTVGYGDIAPQTPLGRAIASIAMITGYAIIAVPTGIITAEIATTFGHARFHRECSGCSLTAHDEDAVFCKHCGTELRGDS